MRTLGNIIWWVPFLGFVPALMNLAVGGLLTLTGVMAPFGLGLMQLGKFLFAPFSQAMVQEKSLMPNLEHGGAWTTLSRILFILYLPFGLILCLCVILEIIGLCFTIIFIPMAIILAKTLSTFFNPIGKVCVPIGVKELMDKDKSQEIYDKYRQKGQIRPEQPEKVKESQSKFAIGAQPSKIHAEAKTAVLDKEIAASAQAQKQKEPKNRNRPAEKDAVSRKNLIWIGCGAIIVILAFFGYIGWNRYAPTNQTERPATANNVPTPLTAKKPSPVVVAPSSTPHKQALDIRQITLLIGTWRGVYHAPQGKTGLTLIVKEKAGVPYCVFTFYPLKENPRAGSGQYEMSVLYDKNRGVYYLKGQKWLKNPDNYQFVDLKGKIMGNTFSGVVIIPNSRDKFAFSLAKKLDKQR